MSRGLAPKHVGFSWGGWSLGSTADKMAKERSELAVVAALAPVCADKFRALPDAEAKTVSLSKAESWKRAEEVPSGARYPPGSNVPEFLPCERLLRVACTEVSCAPVRGVRNVIRRKSCTSMFFLIT